MFMMLLKDYCVEVHFLGGLLPLRCQADPLSVPCSIETIPLGDKRIHIRTSVLEEKATACNMLCCYADELKEGFAPWVEQVRPHSCCLKRKEGLLCARKSIALFLIVLKKFS
jgi:hypothetical protein